jgi:hypothetical protein
MKKVFLSIAVLATLFASCKKDDDNNNKSRHDMVIGTWTMNQWGADANNNQVLDAGETVPTSASTVNGTFTFNANGTAVAVASFLGITDTSSGTWALVDNDNYLQTISDGDTTYMLIKSISNNNLTVLDTTDASMNAAQWYVLGK